EAEDTTSRRLCFLPLLSLTTMRRLCFLPLLSLTTMRRLCSLPLLSLTTMRRLCFLLLLLSLTTGGVCSAICSPQINVRRNQGFLVRPGHSLEVPCPVSFCPNEKPAVFWNKTTTRQSEGQGDRTTTAFQTRWDNLTEASGVFYLVFTRLLNNDSGEYRCETMFTKGHFINITVTESPEITTVMFDQGDNESPEVTTVMFDQGDNATGAEPSGGTTLRTYLWASGVVLCVVGTIVLPVVSMKRCPGHRRTTPACLPQHPVQKPSTASRTSRNDRLYGRREEEEEEDEEDGEEEKGEEDEEEGEEEEGEEDKEEGEEEEGSDWYAALNHESLAATSSMRHGSDGSTVVYAAVVHRS
ncbi:hypothetical protein NHX12_000451, partial [Muraenolepis orangiensis]